MTAPFSGAPRATPAPPATPTLAAAPPSAANDRATAPNYRVSVAEEAVIVERGERRRKWFVREGHGWVRVGEFAAAVLEADDDGERCPAGVVWRRRYELTLPRGARLMALSTFPRVAARSTLWYLSHGLGKAELVYQQRQYFVAGNYRLIEEGRLQERVRSERPNHSKA